MRFCTCCSHQQTRLFVPKFIYPFVCVFVYLLFVSSHLLRHCEYRLLASLGSRLFVCGALCEIRAAPEPAN